MHNTLYETNTDKYIVHKAFPCIVADHNFIFVNLKYLWNLIIERATKLFSLKNACTYLILLSKVSVHAFQILLNYFHYYFYFSTWSLHPIYIAGWGYWLSQLFEVIPKLINSVFQTHCSWFPWAFKIHLPCFPRWLLAIYSQHIEVHMLCLDIINPYSYCNL